MTMRTKIEGLVLTDLRQIPDDRGAVLHMLRCDSPSFTRFGECYFSEVRPGAVKAWKKHRLQTQNLAVPIGRIKLVVYDERHESSTNGQLMRIDLGRPDSYMRVTIPQGLWYGFACLGKNPALLVNCPDLPHDPNDSDKLPEDDALIPYEW